MAAVADIYSQIKALGADAVAISTDSVLDHKVFHDISPSASKVQYPLLADQSGKTAQDYGVWHPSGTAYRATFIIDPESLIRYYSVYPQGVGRNVNEIVRILQALQYGSTTGQGVPTGWIPGMSGIIMDIANAGRI